VHCFFWNTLYKLDGIDSNDLVVSGGGSSGLGDDDDDIGRDGGRPMA